MGIQVEGPEIVFMGSIVWDRARSEMFRSLDFQLRFRSSFGKVQILGDILNGSLDGKLPLFLEWMILPLIRNGKALR